MKRVLAALLVVLATLTGAQAAEKWCAQESEYRDVFKSTVADLRWSLFALSVFAEAGEIDKDLLKGLTNASAISLANTLSLRASYLTTCALPQKDYYQRLQENQAFATLLLRVTSSEKFPATPRIRHKSPQLILWSDPRTVIGDKQLPLHSVISQRLRSLRNETEGSRNSPYFIAASELLGENPNWDEHEVRVTPTIFATKGVFHDKSLEDSLSLIRDKNPVNLLVDFEYYYDVSKAPSGVPSSVLKR